MSELAQGTVHQAAADLQSSLLADHGVLLLWQALTPLGRNEFICWVEDAKQPATRQRRITRPRINDLLCGKISKFSLDALVNLAAQAGLAVEIHTSQAA